MPQTLELNTSTVDRGIDGTKQVQRVSKPPFAQRAEADAITEALATQHRKIKLHALQGGRGSIRFGLREFGFGP